MNLTEILSRASELRIAVVGDLITDRYIDGVIERISPEAPVPVLKITGTRENPGGAGNVVENLKGLGCQVSAFYGKHVPIKTRVMCGTHHIIRMDEEEQPYWMTYDEYDIGLDYGIMHKKYDCVVISDYSKGAISRDVTSKLIRACNDSGIPVVVDTKHNLNLMHHATLVKCNHKEWEAYFKQKINETPFDYLEQKDGHHLVVTSGGAGMQYWTKNGDIQISGNMPAHPISICDTCGAGDTVIAVLAICIAQAKDMDSLGDACELANIAASEVCQHPGVVAINKEALIKRFNEVMK